jgi:sirohydrochlorin ferrochelatase
MRVGYAGDGPASLAAVLAAIAAERGAGGSVLEGGEYCPYHAVVVPMALAPEPAGDAGLAAAAGQPGVTVTPPLGPHPVLAGALHDRLAEAGLAPPRRVSGLTLVSTQIGVLVCAGGEAAQPAAETVAVLLSARLGMPVAPVRLGSRDSLEAGVTRLREAGASRLAMAPYIIGPEFPAGQIADAATSIGAVCAAPLGAHPALGQLATMRYGAALLNPAPAARPGHQIA